jgi:hypothetical protein
MPSLASRAVRVAFRGYRGGMAKESRGIEVFGRGATFVEPRARQVPSRWLGAAALLASLVALVLLGLAIAALLGGEDSVAAAQASFVASVVGGALGLAALLSGRGRLFGLLAIALAAAANPWLLHRLLDWAASVGSP